MDTQDLTAPVVAGASTLVTVGVVDLLVSGGLLGFIGGSICLGVPLVSAAYMVKKNGGTFADFKAEVRESILAQFAADSEEEEETGATGEGTRSDVPVIYLPQRPLSRVERLFNLDFRPEPQTVSIPASSPVPVTSPSVISPEVPDDTTTNDTNLFVDDDGEEEEAKIAVPIVPVQGYHEPVRKQTTIALADNFTIDINKLIGEGIAVIGIKNSGKTNIGALLAEQYARFHVPLVIFDKEGDYASTLTEFPNGRHAGNTMGNHAYTDNYLHVTLDTAYQFGIDILEHGYQVVVDLASYKDRELMVDIMCQMCLGLMEYADSLPARDRVPCPIFLDEANYWLPQETVDYLSKESRLALLDTFHTMATTGRKRGLTTILLGQRISEIKKSALGQAGVYFLGKQMMDNDVTRYKEYINKSVASPDDIKGFAPGEFVVLLADGKQFRTRFFERKSVHISHTPKVEAAMRRYGPHVPQQPQAQSHLYGSSSSSSSLRMRGMERTSDPSLPVIPYSQSGQNNTPQDYSYGVQYRHYDDQYATTPEAPMPRVPTMELVRQQERERYQQQVQQVPQNAPTRQQQQTLSPKLQQALKLYQQGMTHRDLGLLLNVSHVTAGNYIQRLKDLHYIDVNGQKRVW